MKAQSILKIHCTAIVLVGTFFYATAIYSAQNSNFTLASLTPGKEVSLRLKDDQAIVGVLLINIDDKTLSYQNDSMSVKIERDLIFRARQGEIYYSDLPLTAEDHARFTDYVSYIRERGDIIVDVENQTYVGIILSENESKMFIRARSATYEVEKRKIAAWRKNGVWYGDAEARQEPSAGMFSLPPYTDKKRVLNYSLLLTGPWAVLPQFGAGIGSNVNWPVFVGLRGTLGYIWVDLNTMGMMAQVSAYLNVNLMNISSVRFFAGTSYLWRAGMIIDYQYGSSMASYRGSRVYGELNQNIYTLHLGLKYKNLLFECGAEMPISYNDSIKRPIGETASERAEIDKGAGRVQSSLDTLNSVSRVYATVSLMF